MEHGNWKPARASRLGYRGVPYPPSWWRPLVVWKVFGLWWHVVSSAVLHFFTIFFWQGRRCRVRILLRRAYTGKHALHINQDNFSCSWVIDNFKKNIPAAIFTRNPFLRSKSPYLKKIISTGGPEMKLPIPIRIYSNAIPKRISSNAIPILHNTYLISYIHLWCSLCYCLQGNTHYILLTSMMQSSKCIL